MCRCEYLGRGRWEVCTLCQRLHKVDRKGNPLPKNGGKGGTQTAKR
jgi:hypothetical protein